MSRSALEEALWGQMRMLSMTEAGFPMPLREVHPFWCCEHKRREHREDVNGPYCLGCIMLAPEDCHHAYVRERDWRCDFLWPEQRIVVEVEGGVWTRGRHTRGDGFTKDLEKYNALTGAGWTLYRVSQREVTSGEALTLLEAALKAPAELKAEGE